MKLFKLDSFRELVAFGIKCRRLATYVNSAAVDVEKHGTLTIDAKSSVEIDSIDCQRYPDQNVAFAHFNCSDGRISWDNSNKILKLILDSNSLQSSRVEIPVKFNVLANVVNKDIIVKNLQNNSIKLTLDNGRLMAKNLLTDCISVLSKSSDITCDGFVQSNAYFIMSEVGSITIKKIIGETLTVKVSKGDINISSLYVENASISTRTGNVNLKSVHKSSNIEIYEKGNINIDSLDGDTKIYVNEGNVEIFAYKHEDISISVDKGNVRISLPEDCKSNLNIKANEIEISNEFKIFPEEEFKESFKGCLNVNNTMMTSSINITCKHGKVSVCKQDWLNAFFRSKQRP